VVKWTAGHFLFYISMAFFYVRFYTLPFLKYRGLKYEKKKKNEYMKMIYTATMYNNKYFLSKDLKVADSQGKKLTGKLSSTISRSGGYTLLLYISFSCIHFFFFSYFKPRYFKKGSV
jgi:exopolysaccharide biosynthesis protein